MSMLFISYSTNDRDIAIKVYERLISRGYHLPFLDYHEDSGIPGGSLWEHELRWHLKVSRALVVLCSKSWLDSKWCFAELDRAKEFGKEIIPLNLDGLPLPPFISAYQSIPFHEHNEHSYGKLWQALEKKGLYPSEDFYWPRDECPYPGLATFNEEHAAIYFGRDQELGEFFETYLDPMQKSGEHRLIYIIGPSGSGKSSFVRAGVIPRLKYKSRGAWLVLTVFRWAELKCAGHRWGERLALDVQRLYGAHPQAPNWKAEERLRRYAVDGTRESFEVAGHRFVLDVKDALLALNRTSTTPIIVLDQFEELLATEQDADKAQFLEFLEHCLAVDDSPCRALATVRSDFVPEIQATPQLIVWNEKTRLFRLDLLKKERLFDVIRRPLHLVDVRFEDELLVSRIVDDIPSSDALPLLAFTLKRFYGTCAKNGILTRQAYETTLGGIHQCLNSVAQEVLVDESLPSGHVTSVAENALRIAFVRELVRFEEGGNEKDGKFVRKTAAWSELPPESKPLLKKMSSESFRLVSIDQRENAEKTIEVTHEALFRQWQTLKSWLEQRQDLLRWKSDITRSRVAAGEKWTGLTWAQLALSSDWLTTRKDELSDNEITWIKQAKSKRRNLRVLVIVVACALCGLTLWANSERITASKQRHAAQVSLARFAFANARFALADPSRMDEGLHWLFKAYTDAPADSVLRLSAASLLSSWGNGECVALCHRPTESDGTSRNVVLSQNSRRLAVPASSQTISVYDIDGANHSPFIVPEQLDLRFSVSNPSQIRLSHSGTVLAHFYRYSGTVDVWNQRASSIKRYDLQTTIEQLVVNDGGTDMFIVDSSGRIVQTNLLTAEQRILHEKANGKCSALALSVDESLLAVMTSSDEVLLFDVKSGIARKIAPPDKAVFGPLLGCAFDSENRWLIAGGGAPDLKSGYLVMWDVKSGAVIASQSVGAGCVWSVAFTETPKCVAIACQDCTVRLLGIDQLHRYVPRERNRERVFVATDEIVEWRNVEVTRKIADKTPPRKPDSINAQIAEFIGQRVATERVSKPVVVGTTPDGSRVVTHSLDIFGGGNYRGIVEVWSLPGGRLLNKIEDELIQTCVLSPDGRIVATQRFDGTVRLWDVETVIPFRESIIPLRSSEISFANDSSAVRFAQERDDFSIEFALLAPVVDNVHVEPAVFHDELKLSIEVKTCLRFDIGLQRPVKLSADEWSKRSSRLRSLRAPWVELPRLFHIGDRERVSWLNLKRPESSE